MVWYDKGIWRGYCDREYGDAKYVGIFKRKDGSGEMGPCHKECKDFVEKGRVGIPNLEDFQEYMVGIRKVVEDGRASYEFLRSDGALADIRKRDNYYVVERVGGNSFGLKTNDALCLKRLLREIYIQ